MFSFSRNRKALDLTRYVRRLSDLTTPNLALVTSGRGEERLNRAIPTLLCPWEDGRPCLEECTVSLTSDISDHGIGLVLSQPFRAEQVVVGFFSGGDAMPEPWYFLGDVRRNQPMGGGYWAIGVELTSFANPDHRCELSALQDTAARLPVPEEAFC